jgi:hypothetical protein
MDNRLKKDIYLTAQPMNSFYTLNTRQRQSVLDSIMRLNKIENINKDTEKSMT